MLFPLYLPSSAFRFLAYSPSTPTCLRFQFFPISPRSIFLLLCLLQHCLLQQYKCRKMAVCMWPIRTIIRAIRLQTVWCCKPLNWLYNYCQDIFQAKIVKMAGVINFVDIEYNRKKRERRRTTVIPEKMCHLNDEIYHRHRQQQRQQQQHQKGRRRYMPFLRFIYVRTQSFSAQRIL